MQRGDMVRVSTKLGFVKCYFVLIQPPYPVDMSIDHFELADHFHTEDIGLVLDAICITSPCLKRAAGLYVEILSPRGKVGWMNSENLETIQSSFI